MAPERTGFVARLGALLVSPRRLARRDISLRDGKGGDDLFLVALFVLVANGASSVARAAVALGGGRFSTAVRRLLEVLLPAGPLLAMWLVSTLALLAFTFRSGRRAVGDLGARVLTGFLIANVLTTPLAALLPPSRVRYLLEGVPWAAAALLFGLVLREAIEEPVEAASPAIALGRRFRLTGILASLLLLAVGAQHAARTLATQPPVPIDAQRGAPAPAVELPLLDGGKLELGKLRGRRVVMIFWATWCGPCMEELPQLEAAYRAHPTDAALVYAVNVDDAGPDRERLVRGVVSRFSLTMPIALDDGAAARAYAVSTIPTLVRIAQDGRIAGVTDRPLDRADLEDALTRP